MRDGCKWYSQAFQNTLPLCVFSISYFFVRVEGGGGYIHTQLSVGHPKRIGTKICNSLKHFVFEKYFSKNKMGIDTKVSLFAKKNIFMVSTRGNKLELYVISSLDTGNSFSWRLILCVDSSSESSSFGSSQVQSIIHAKIRKLGNWEVCSNIFAKMDRVLLSPK